MKNNTENSMEILLGIDDTDNLESIGTGALLQKLCEDLSQAGLARCDFITRHQLLIDDAIAYTSHNSSMCCRAELEKDNFDRVIHFTQNFLEENRAEGSDPGLCVVCLHHNEKFDDLLAFGLTAQKKVLQKADAYGLAKKYQGIIFLSEHGGTGDGIIGALAGCGLRLSGMDGKIKAKIKPENPDTIMSVRDFCHKFNISWALDENFKEVSPEETVRCGESFKLFLWRNKHTVILTPNGVNADWHPIKKQGDRKEG